MTLTLDIPDDLAERLEAIPPDQRNNYAVSALRKQLEEDEDDELDPADYPSKFPNPSRREDCTPEEIAMMRLR